MSLHIVGDAEVLNCLSKNEETRRHQEWIVFSLLAQIQRPETILSFYNCVIAKMHVVATRLHALLIEGINHPLFYCEFGYAAVNQSGCSDFVFCLSTVSSIAFSSDTSRENTERRQ